MSIRLPKSSRNPASGCGPNLGTRPLPFPSGCGFRSSRPHLGEPYRNRQDARDPLDTTSILPRDDGRMHRIIVRST